MSSAASESSVRASQPCAHLYAPAGPRPSALASVAPAAAEVEQTEDPCALQTRRTHALVPRPKHLSALPRVRTQKRSQAGNIKVGSVRRILRTTNGHGREVWRRRWFQWGILLSDTMSNGSMPIPTLLLLIRELSLEQSIKKIFWPDVYMLLLFNIPILALC